jgi:signal transduction histidine kinase
MGSLHCQEGSVKNINRAGQVRRIGTALMRLIGMVDTRNGGRMLQEYAEERRTRKVLAFGFFILILLLLADGYAWFRSVRSIRTAANEIAEDLFVQMALLDEVQSEQASLSAIYYRLEGDPESVNRDNLLAQIAARERNIRKIISTVPVDSPQQGEWERLVAASTAFAAEARRLLSIENSSSLHSRMLIRNHEEVVDVVAQLVRLSHARAHAAKERIDALSSSQLRKHGVLLGVSIVLAMACAAIILRTSSRMYRKMTEQSEELSKISWQLLESQETVARKLSHELHDELGQTLTALKTNLAVHADAPCVNPGWLQDCSVLLKDSIRSAHEISQLLRPTILDDFGLDSALNWLCERFGDRTGIEVDCAVGISRRLSVETETQLFRIAQEALTNVARHSAASNVSIELREETNRVRLLIKDNGRGLPPPAQIRKGALGLTGMRARARSCGGEVKIESGPGQGVCIEVWVPLVLKEDEAKDTHLVG